MAHNDKALVSKRIRVKSSAPSCVGWNVLMRRPSKLLEAIADERKGLVKWQSRRTRAVSTGSSYAFVNLFQIIVRIWGAIGADRIF